MELHEILKTLARFTSKYPTEAVEAAMGMQERITPELLRILEETVTRADEIVANDPDEEYFAHMYALFLLAQFRETQAYPLVVKLARLKEAVIEALLGDSVTEDLSHILASVCDGDLGPIKALIEDPTLYEYARDAALGSLCAMVAEGALDRDELIAYFKELFEGKLERTYSLVWESLAADSVDLYPEEVAEYIADAYAEGLVTRQYMNPKDVDRALTKGKEATLDYFAQNARGYIKNTVDEMKWWACFTEPPRRKSPSPPHCYQPVLPVRQMPKIGRNDLCPCGSGKKFKKCCLSG